MDSTPQPERKALGRDKFVDARVTATGARRASVGFQRLATLWFNTGTLCNLTCGNCYIESSPRNDRLSYLSASEVRAYLDEIAEGKLATEEIGFTGGEPFMNPDLMEMMAEALARGFRVLVLTNAMKPMMKCADDLCELNRRFGARLKIRVSLDHYGKTLHELERGPHSWEPTLIGLKWLAANGFAIDIAGRSRWGESEQEMRRGYADLFAEHAIPVDAEDPVALVLFPEMDAGLDVAEITEQCWDILKIAPESVMCATSRMVVKRKGAAHPVVVSCTLLPYDKAFEMGTTLSGADAAVALNHPHCARFCILGGGSCSS
jgi:uncharacterized Fe-S cluster-containing radical SAM superfamily protein